MNPLWYLENGISPNDCIGIDEVGRGPLAGPVVTSAVWISEEGIALIEKDEMNVRDSKKLSHKQRKKILSWLDKQPENILKYSIAMASVEEIDSLNILQATFLAMQRAYSSLNLVKPLTLIDGNKAPELKNTQVRTIVKGDDTVMSIALASIIAKEYRDNLMKELDKKYPQYGWNTNVGYGSQQHICAIFQYGATPHHRKTFAPVKDLDKANKEISKAIASQSR
jgi:ribonuclease HII